MAYFDISVAAVSTGQKEAYTAFARTVGQMFKEHGALSVIDTRGDDVPDGKVTDYRKAVAAKDGETVAVGWVAWPDKAVRDKAWETLMGPDSPMNGLDMPFDGKRMIFGAFDAISEL